MDVSRWKKLARGKTRAGSKPRGKMNKLEAAYSEHLKLQKLAGEVLWYEYEVVTFTLTRTPPKKKGEKPRMGIRYTPDFAVMLPDGMFELHEVKGFLDTEDLNRLKVAAEKFPFQFVMVTRRTKKDGGGWVMETF